MAGMVSMNYTLNSNDAGINLTSGIIPGTTKPNLSKNSAIVFDPSNNPTSYYVDTSRLEVIINDQSAPDVKDVLT